MRKNMDDIKTGDLLLFSRKSVTGLFVRTFMNSTWNHVGIALRLKDLGHNGSESLHVLDVRAIRRYDAWSGQIKTGAGCSPIGYSLKNSCSIAWRKMADQYRTPDYFQRFKEFIDKSINTKAGTASQMVSTWSGLQLYSGVYDRCTCSEFVARYLDHQISRDKLGKNYPKFNWLVSPGSFSAKTSGESDAYQEESYIYHHPKNLFTFASIVVVLIFIIFAVLWMWPKIVQYLHINMLNP